MPCCGSLLGTSFGLGSPPLYSSYLLLRKQAAAEGSSQMPGAATGGHLAAMASTLEVVRAWDVGDQGP